MTIYAFCFHINGIALLLLLSLDQTGWKIDFFFFFCQCERRGTNLASKTSDVRVKVHWRHTLLKVRVNKCQTPNRGDEANVRLLFQSPKGKNIWVSKLSYNDWTQFSTMSACFVCKSTLQLLKRAEGLFILWCFVHWLLKALQDTPRLSSKCIRCLSSSQSYRFSLSFISGGLEGLRIQKKNIF